MRIRIGERCCRTSLRLLLVILLISTQIVAFAQVGEYDVKAAFLLNFTIFIEWLKPLDLQQTFTICILGDDPFQSAIDRLTKNKTAYGRPLGVRRLMDAAEAKSCQIVFVRGDYKKSERLIEAARGGPILTVGETQEFLRMGGMVYLSMAENRVTIVINNVAAENAGLRISAKLLSLATVFKNTDRAPK